MSFENKKKKKGPLPPPITKSEYTPDDLKDSSNDSFYDEAPDLINLDDDPFDLPPVPNNSGEIESDFEDNIVDPIDNDILPPNNFGHDTPPYTQYEKKQTQDRKTFEAEPPPIYYREYDLEYDPDISYLFIFGPSTTGKTVMISSILYYLENVRSVEYGDSIKNINDPSKAHEREGNKLWKELSSTLFDNQFPKGTAAVKQDNPFPRHINAHFIPNDKSAYDFKFCLMDMSGEDLEKVDYDAEEKIPESIKVYVEKMPKDNMCFMYVLDPKSDAYSKSQQLGIFKAFIDLLDQHNHESTPLLFLVSKWDLVANEYENVEDYVKKEFPPIWGTLNQQVREITYTEFSIGDVDNDLRIIRKYNPSYAEKVFKWFYNVQNGKVLASKNQNTKKGFFSKRFKK